mgnify:CR=1 FL=1
MFTGQWIKDQVPIFTFAGTTWNELKSFVDQAYYVNMDNKKMKVEEYDDPLEIGNSGNDSRVFEEDSYQMFSDDDESNPLASQNFEQLFSVSSTSHDTELIENCQNKSGSKLKGKRKKSNALVKNTEHSSRHIILDVYKEEPKSKSGERKKSYKEYKKIHRSDPEFLQNLSNAIDAYRSGMFKTKLAAAREFGIPIVTFSRYVVENKAIELKTYGPKSTLSVAEQQDIVDLIKMNIAHGSIVFKSDIGLL